MHDDTQEIRFDWQRNERKGIGEVVYCPGKSAAHLKAIHDGALDRGANVAFSRLESGVNEALNFASLSAHWTYNAISKLGTLVIEPAPKYGKVAVVTAGTTDIPAAEEAAGIAEFSGCVVARFFDVGVAGIHRVLSIKEDLADAAVVIVAAGMEGALPSVVSGLVPGLVIGLPTSVGYGVAAGGHTALMAMLASCSPGIVVVNIDNGIGAGLSAALVARK